MILIRVPGGLRACKYAGSSTQPCQTGGATQYSWDVAGSLPLLLKDGTTAYIYGPGGLPLEQVNTSATFWYHHDHLGSTRLVTTSSGGTAATYTFDPYGGLAASTNPGGITNPFGFCGQYKDSESGFYYLRARYFDTATGQFTSIDPSPISTQGPYRYATDNPLNQIDPTGLCSLNPFAGDSCVGQAANPFSARSMWTKSGCKTNISAVSDASACGIVVSSRPNGLSALNIVPVKPAKSDTTLTSGGSPRSAICAKTGKFPPWLEKIRKWRNP